jgi:hypothetical protein
MRKLSSILIPLILLLSFAASAQNVPAATATQPATGDDNAQLRQELEQMKKAVTALEERLTAQEKAAQQKQEDAKKEEAKQAPAADQPNVAELATEVKDLDHRVAQTERRGALDRLNWSGDFRVETNSIFAHIPTHYDGMQLQSLMVKTLWTISPTAQGGLGMSLDPSQLPANPADYATYLKGLVAANYGQYQFFANNLTFNQLKSSFGAFPASLQQMLLGYLQQVPGVLTAGYGANANELATNRLRLNFDAHVSDNVEVAARVSMYKVFGDSTNVQVFNGQPTSLNIDGTTATVPTGDFLRVERAYFTWNHIGGLPMYLSVGRRPSTNGPPLEYREDELRGGTPSGTLIDYQFDGLTFGYHVGDKTTFRLCYGLGFDSGFGNGQNLQQPADRVKGVQFLGANIDAYSTDKSLVQITIARAWNVTDGFNGLVVLPNNPLTGDPIGGAAVLRFTPSANLGAIDLYGLTLEHRIGSFDLYTSINADSLRPNGLTTPFGGMGANPFDVPANHNGFMFYGGARYNVARNDGRTKIGVEFNDGSKYWFNFAQAEDDIFAPKTSARGQVYETYLTHRITPHFILKVDYQRFHYTWSGSGWDVGAPERLSDSPLLGFPTYDRGSMMTVGMTARF